MMKLIPFELAKFWRKKNFCLVMALIFFVNLFFLWFLNQSDPYTPGLSDYKRLHNDLKSITAEKQYDWLQQRYEDIENYAVVDEILTYRSRNDDFAKQLEAGLIQENPGVFEKYHEKYISGEYLKYTDSLEKEAALLGTVYGEFHKVHNYGDFLRGISERKEKMSGISIFSADTESFSAKNMGKEEADYSGMTGLLPVPNLSAPITAALELPVSDLLLYLAVIFFGGAMIYEEREKKLFLITFSTAKGRFSTISAKLGALALHCFTVTGCLYGSNFAWSFAAAGFPDITAPLQSLGPYMESTLKLSIGGFIILNVLLKGLALFSFGTLLLTAAIAFKQNFMSLFAGGLCVGVSGLLYNVIPANGWNNWFKFLNLYGAMKTDKLLGGYLNLNFFGQPVSRCTVVVMFLCIVCLLGAAGTTVLFLRGKNLSAEQRENPAAKLYGKIRAAIFLKRRSLRGDCRNPAYGGIFSHESWKILIMQRSIVILLLFTIFIGYQHVSKPYEINGAESYYKAMMMELSGELTEEKKALIEKEQARYDKAFAEIERIEGLIACGEIDEQAGNAMMEPYQRETAFYPSFQRIIGQYQWICQHKTGRFVYDTGYLLLFGFSESGAADAMADYILLALCIILAFSCTFAMEYQAGAWNLLAATACGKRKIQRGKVGITLLIGTVMTLLIFASNVAQILIHCPLNQLTASTMCISPYRNVGIDVPLWLWVGVLLLVRMLVVTALIVIVLLISEKMKNQLMTMCLSGLILVIPPLLYAMGLEFTRWWSLLPVYQFGTLVV